MSTEIGLRDGRTVQLRPTQPSDEAELVQGFGRMSAQARYMRLMHVVREPDIPRMRAVLASFPKEGIGYVATVPAADGIDIVGSVIALFAPGGESCEFAVTVDERFAGAGLATAMMKVLIAQTRRRGFKRMEGYVLSENEAMLRLARALGFGVKYMPGDASVRICTLPLA